MQYIGKLKVKQLGEYKKNVLTSNVIITNERIEHTKKRHPGDYEKYINYIGDIIKEPDYILKDNDNIDTILVLKRIKENENLQIVIKLLTTEKDKDKSNTILTFWKIRNRSYNSAIKNNPIIYQKLDKK